MGGRGVVGCLIRSLHPIPSHPIPSHSICLFFFFSSLSVHSTSFSVCLSLRSLFVSCSPHTFFFLFLRFVSFGLLGWFGLGCCFFTHPHHHHHIITAHHAFCTFSPSPFFLVRRSLRRRRLFFAHTVSECVTPPPLSLFLSCYLGFPPVNILLCVISVCCFTH